MCLKTDVNPNACKNCLDNKGCIEKIFAMSDEEFDKYHEESKKEFICYDCKNFDDESDFPNFFCDVTCELLNGEKITSCKNFKKN